MPLISLSSLQKEMEMTIPRTTAKRLVSETEFRLINDSFPPQVSHLSDKGLTQRLERARKARDRYHEMVERQQNKPASSSQRGANSPANLKEAISKERLFDETLARFERQTAKAGTGGMHAAANTPARSVMGKKASGEKGGSQGTSKASVKTANKAAAKGGAKPVKAGKGKGAATKQTPRGRYKGTTATTTLH